MTKPNPDVNPADNGQSAFGVILHSFFVVPFLIAVFCVLLFLGVNMLTREQRTVYDDLEDIQTGGETKRWQAAFELSRIMANPDAIPEEDRFFRELGLAFEKSWQDTPMVRQYLAVALGHSGRPEFFETLTAHIKEADEQDLFALIYALGMLKDERAAETLHEYLKHPDPRIRSITATALGEIGSPASAEFLKKALSDSEPNVKWGASLALARMGHASGRDQLMQLLNRKYLTQFPAVDPQEQDHLMLAAIEAAQNIRDPQLTERIREVSRQDPNFQVRVAAEEFLENAQ